MEGKGNSKGTKQGMEQKNKIRGWIRGKGGKGNKNGSMRKLKVGESE